MLLESIIAITVITVVMSAVGVEFVGSVVSASHQRASQVAVQLGDSALEQIRSLDASDLVTGRDPTSVREQLAAAGSKVRPWLAGMDPISDSTAAAPSGATASLPTVGVISQSPRAVAYTINDYLGECFIRTSGSTGCEQAAALGRAARTPYLRAVVAVTWHGQGCPEPTAGKPTREPCTYVTSTLISGTADPVFRVDEDPYPQPVVEVRDSRTSRTSVVGDVVSVRLSVREGTGAPLFRWQVSAGDLPRGLTLDAGTGLISGTVEEPASAEGKPFAVTIEVTDSFLRTAQLRLQWTVLAALTYRDPGPVTTERGTEVIRVLVTEGGNGLPYTFTDAKASLPPGLSISEGGLISGTPRTAGRYTVAITLSDSSSRPSFTVPFTWTVTQPPLVPAVPDPQVSTLSTEIPVLSLSATGGSGSYLWSDTRPSSLPRGLTLDATTGRISGTPTALGSSTAGITVSSDGAARTVSLPWNVVPPPTVTAPADQAATAGTFVTLRVQGTCPHSPCGYAFGGVPPSGLTISGDGLITGQVGTTVGRYAGISVAATDAAGAVGRSATFSWTVNGSPRMASPGDQTTLRGGRVSVELSSLVSGGTPAFSYDASGLPTWLKLDRTTGVISGTAPAGGDSTNRGITVSVTDASKVMATSGGFTWTVSDMVGSVSDRTTYESTPVDARVVTDVVGGVAPYSFAASGLPAWLKLDALTGVVSGTAPAVRSNSTVASSPVTVTVTDKVGASIVLRPFTWFTTDMIWGWPAEYRTGKKDDILVRASDYLTGGAAGKTYTATGLPTGLTMNPLGVISGSTLARDKDEYTVGFTVTDDVGATVVTTVLWTVK